MALTNRQKISISVGCFFAVVLIITLAFIIFYPLNNNNKEIVQHKGIPVREQDINTCKAFLKHTIYNEDLPKNIKSNDIREMLENFNFDKRLCRRDYGEEVKSEMKNKQVKS